MAKVNISIDDDLLKRLDDYCDSHFTTRSGAISHGVTNLLLADDVRNSIKKMSFAFESIAQNGVVSEEDLLKLEQFHALAKVLSGDA